MEKTDRQTNMLAKHVMRLQNSVYSVAVGK